MRGKAFANYVTLGRERITPAYAGKSILPLLPDRSHQDHPRLCGEKFLSALWKIFWTGSPPPMRGKVSFGVVEDLLDRITPAYAGKRGVVFRGAAGR